MVSEEWDHEIVAQHLWLTFPLCGDRTKPRHPGARVTRNGGVAWEFTGHQCNCSRVIFHVSSWFENGVMLQIWNDLKAIFQNGDVPISWCFFAKSCTGPVGPVAHPMIYILPAGAESAQGTSPSNSRNQNKIITEGEADHHSNPPLHSHSHSNDTATCWYCITHLLGMMNPIIG